MNYRFTEIWPQKTYNTDQTEIIDINLKDPISQIIIDADCYNSDETTLNGHPVRGITKIELVDGSDVLFSLSGAEAHAVDFYHNKRERQGWFHFMSNNYTDYAIALNFGRYLWDPLLALDPMKFSNLQLKLTFDIDAGGSNASEIRCRVTANVFDEKGITPAGFLMHKEKKSYTLVDDGHEYTDLPTDYPYRKLFVRAQRYGTEPNQQLESIKLTEDNDKRVIINQLVARWMRNIISLTPPYREGILVKAPLTKANMYCTPTSTVNGNLTIYQAVVDAGVLAWSEGDGGRFGVIAESVARYAWSQIAGWCPHGVLEMPFGLQDNPEDWFDVTKVGSLIVDIESAGSVGTGQTCEIFLQQLRKYA